MLTSTYDEYDLVRDESKYWTLNSKFNNERDDLEAVETEASSLECIFTQCA
jgi:hypothetical protein